MKIFLASLVYFTVLFGPAVVAHESVILSSGISSPPLNIPNAVLQKPPTNVQVVPDTTPSVEIHKNKMSSFDLPSLSYVPKPILYPRLAVRRGWEGETTVAVEVLASGVVGRQHIVKSSGRQLFDQTALESVQSWKFHPALRNGKPVVEYLEIPISFQLQD